MAGAFTLAAVDELVVLFGDVMLPWLLRRGHWFALFNSHVRALTLASAAGSARLEFPIFGGLLARNHSVSS